ncbi:hypothetical protein N7495_005308 [Penicillium taxi]|uniref:uncharacterized protein n=1 Tax=Penicillium taxi TaxID=168475 RepID=UPI00254513E5|nr:uncharacterized protein N7495_005308 [Penicillium taxi]KAJ5893617.1 hypothetical protein N7495_005308 [Penicillium taxi]
MRGFIRYDQTKELANDKKLEIAHAVAVVKGLTRSLTEDEVDGPVQKGGEDDLEDIEDHSDAAGSEQ